MQMLVVPPITMDGYVSIAVSEVFVLTFTPCVRRCLMLCRAGMQWLAHEQLIEQLDVFLDG